MARILGTGVEKLREFVRQCKAAGGTPVFRTKFAGVEYKDRVIVACYGKGEKVKGGTVTGLSPILVQKIRNAVKGAGTMSEEKLRELGLL